MGRSHSERMEWWVVGGEMLREGSPWLQRERRSLRRWHMLVVGVEVDAIDDVDGM